MTWGPPVGIVAVTANVSPSITEMLLSSLLVMYANRPSADHAACCGNRPTGMSASTVLVSVSITDAESAS